MRGRSFCANFNRSSFEQFPWHCMWRIFLLHNFLISNSTQIPVQERKEGGETNAGRSEEKNVTSYTKYHFMFYIGNICHSSTFNFFHIFLRLVENNLSFRKFKLMSPLITSFAYLQGSNLLRFLFIWNPVAGEHTRAEEIN